MSHNIKILIFSLFVLIVSCSTNNPLFDPQEIHIKSETKWLVDNNNDSKIRTVSYKEYDRDKRLIKSEDFDDSGLLVQMTTRTYQANKHFEHVTTYKNGIEVNSVLNSYMIDGKGNITERISNTHAGDTIEIIRYNYDSKGNITEESTFDKNGNLKGKRTFLYEYNNNGFVTGRLVNNDLLNGFQSKDTIIYKPEKNIIERFSYNSLGSLEAMISYYYDNNGNVQTETFTDRNGNIIKKYKYEYTYY